MPYLQAETCSCDDCRGREPDRLGCEGKLTLVVPQVKCDETRPSCHKCLQKGFTCGGYSRDLVWSYKHQPDRRSKASSRRNSRAKEDKRAEEYRNAILPTPQSDETDTLDLTSNSDDSVSLSLLPFDVFDDGCSQFFDTDMQALSPTSSLQLQPANLLLDFDLPMTGNRPATPRTSISSQGSTIWNQEPLPSTFSIPNLPRAPGWTDGPDATLALINSWFDQVCPAWSAFDSTTNLNRKLANTLWHHSACVFNSLQSMAASFLSARIPHLRGQALGLLKTASVCIQAEIDELKTKPRIDTFPTGLLFSLLCLGTSVCWLDARLLGLPYLKEARALLTRLSEQYQYQSASDDDAENFIFFRNSLVYWEMLLAVVADSEVVGNPTEIMTKRLQLPERSASETSTDLLPHPWTGVSSRTARLFSKSITLCRAYRRILTKPTGRVVTLSAAMDAFQDAQKLEKQLLELDYSPAPTMNDTGDQRTPWLHLASAANAYQLSALLQLYVTFPDLVSMRLQLDPSEAIDDHVSWDKLITPLTLDLIKVLEKIPPESGSRVIQPVLYICASTGLRYSSAATSTSRLERRPSDAASELDCNSASILEYADQIDTTGCAQADSGPVTTGSLDISSSREFIIRRLGILESTLQPRPIIVAKELVKAIWDAYDKEPQGTISTHWLDVMEAHDLRSLFG